MSVDDLTELKEALKRKGWTQEAAAAECGVSQPHLNYVLNGQRQSLKLVRCLQGLAKRRGKRRVVAR